MYIEIGDICVFYFSDKVQLIQCERRKIQWRVIIYICVLYNWSCFSTRGIEQSSYKDYQDTLLD